MNEDYLWDKSGEPDTEIERLEKTLGRLRYKRPAEPLPLPAISRWPLRLSFSPALAIAAALLILLLAGGIWLGLRPSGSREIKNTLATSTTPEEKQTTREVSGPRPPLGTGNPTDDRLVDGRDNQGTAAPDNIAPRHKPSRRFSGARQSVARLRNLKAAPNREQLVREGEQAKAQLIMALHIASDKLNAVQKLIQPDPGT